jgi:hypothetical protein
MFDLSLTPFTTVLSIKKYLRRDDLYKEILDLDDLDEYQPNLKESVWCLVKEGDEEKAILLFKLFSSNCIEFHGGIFKEHRSQDTAKKLKYLLDKIKEGNSGAALVTKIVATNIPALKVVEKMGFKQKCIIKNGARSGDLILMGEE